MKNTLYSVLLACVFSPLMAQHREIAFEHAPLSDLLARSAKEHKLIFVDCYTSWCGPCKEMSAHVFTQDTVADFFNSRLISLKLDMEKGEGPEVGKKYRVAAYPSYLLLNEKGELVYKFIGGMPAKEFLKKVAEGMDPDNRVAQIFRKYDAGDRSPALMREYIVLTLRNREVKRAKELNAEYTQSLTAQQKLLPENWFLYGENQFSRELSDMHSPNFTYLVTHWRDFAKVKGIDSINHKISGVFRKMTSYCMEGYYQKDIGYKKEDFVAYREQIKNTAAPDKKDLLIMMDIAEAACQKDAERVTNLIADNVANFSSPNMDIVFAYVSFIPSFKKKEYPRWIEIMHTVAAHSQNPFLVDHVKSYF
ncbi:thioredoxin family protein [Chitinophaga sp.]|uniref:thioredoxin family protein n=1 Tax=Chitinophaga sp. TaxID=1869181 RepID=UPI0031D383D1